MSDAINNCEGDAGIFPDRKRLILLIVKCSQSNCSIVVSGENRSAASDVICLSRSNVYIKMIPSFKVKPSNTGPHKDRYQDHSVFV